MVPSTFSAVSSEVSSRCSLSRSSLLPEKAVSSLGSRCGARLRKMEFFIGMLQVSCASWPRRPFPHRGRTARNPRSGRPVRVISAASDDMDMKLAHDVADRGNVDLFAPVAFFNATPTVTCSKVSMAWSSGVRSKISETSGRCGTRISQGQRLSLRSQIADRASGSTRCLLRGAHRGQRWHGVSPDTFFSTLAVFLALGLHLATLLPICLLGRLVVDEPLANRVRSGRKQP